MKVRRAEVRPTGDRARKEFGEKSRRILVYPRKDGAWKATRSQGELRKGQNCAARDYPRDAKIKGGKTKVPMLKKLKYGHRGDVNPRKGT